MPAGIVPTVIVAVTVLIAVLTTDTARRKYVPRVCNVDLLAVRGDRHTKGSLADGNRSYNRIRGGIDDDNAGTGLVGNVNIPTVRTDDNTEGLVDPGNRRHCARSCIDNRHRTAGEEVGGYVHFPTVRRNR